ncbi:MAG: hypothetical protein ABI238_06315 [Terrimesophilobacter sp.]
MSEIAVTYLGGPTVLLEYEGLRVLTDPTIDESERYPDPDGGQALVKTRGPAIGLSPGETREVGSVTVTAVRALVSIDMGAV